VGKVGDKELLGLAKAMDGCLDKLDAGQLSGNAQTTCLGAWTAGGLVTPADPTTAAGVAKAAAKAATTIQAKCSPATLAPLDACGGGTAAGVADCTKCAAFSQTAALIDDTY